MDTHTLDNLLDRYIDGALLPGERCQLEQMLLESADVREVFWERVQLHGLIRDCYEARSGQQLADAAIGSFNAAAILPAVTDRSEKVYAPFVDACEVGLSDRVPSGPFGANWHRAATLLSGWPVAYLVAVMVLGIGLLVGYIVHVPNPSPIANDSGSPIPSALDPKTLFVGRITGMVECQWSDPTTVVPGPIAVPLGRKYALSSGLLEITYDTGAKVILQGPCNYEVDTPTGGYLAVGKLTARVENTARQSPNPKSQIRNSSPFFPLPFSLFVIRTPTAVVTDLGTEFGVEVNEKGDTTSRVFRGSVELRAMTAQHEPTGHPHVLHENESAIVERTGDSDELVLHSSARPVDFVRVIPKTMTKSLDMVDVVAGGDGFSGRRNRGIDVTTGLPCDAPPISSNFILVGDAKYRRVEGMPFIDGVFVPDWREGPMQIDSAGHTFVGYSQSTDPGHRTSGYLWAGGLLAIPPCIQTEDYSAYVKSLRHLPVILDGVDYSSPGHGVLCIHPNKGITFDLDAIRRANPDWTIARFCAAAANVDVAPELAGLADIRVFVDGQPRFQRRATPRSNSAFSLSIAISTTDRFLTLMSTDGDDTFFWDWVVFGDPRLEMHRTKSELNR